jgi:hypothetical protein
MGQLPLPRSVDIRYYIANRTGESEDVTTVAVSIEQSMLAATAAQTVSDHPYDEQMIVHRSTKTALWSALVAHGFGVGRGGCERRATLNAALVLERLARGVSVVPYLGTALALNLLQAANAMR